MLYEIYKSRIRIKQKGPWFLTQGPFFCRISLLFKRFLLLATLFKKDYRQVTSIMMGTHETLVIQTCILFL